MTSPVTAEVRSILDLAIGERTGVEHAEGVAREAKCSTGTFQIPALQRDPRKTLGAAISQIWTAVLSSRLGILLTYGVDGAGVKSKCRRASGSQAVEIKTARPRLIPFESALLGIVAVVPDVIYRLALTIKQALERFDPIAVDEDHCISIQLERMISQLVTQTGVEEKR